MIYIADLQKLNKPEHIAITEHARQRLIERGITINDIMRCIADGEIVKQYEDDKPFPSCLILGMTENNSYIHVVVSHDEEYIYLITAYHPDHEMWEPDLKTRKERS